MSHFSKLCSELAIDSQQHTPEGLNQLRKFCQETISKDRIFLGSDEHQFSSYKQLAINYLEKVQPNLSQGQLNETLSDDEKTSLIEHLVKQGYSEILKGLTLEAAQLNYFDGLMSPLHMSAKRGYAETTQALLDKGADPRLKNKRNELAINYVLDLPMLYEPNLVAEKKLTFEKLYAHAPDTINNLTKDGTTVAHQMALYGYNHLLETIIDKHVELLFKANNLGRLPIHVAILNRQFKAMLLLLATGKASEMLDFKLRNPLHYAALYGSKEMVAACIKALGDIEAVDNNGCTPLLLAAHNGNIDALEELLAHNADLLAKDLANTDAITLATEHNHSEIAELLAARQAISSPTNNR